MDPGLRKKQRRDRIYNRFHRGFVNICIGITLAGGAVLGIKIYEYFKYIRPLHKAQHELSQDELLNEGKSITASSTVELST